MFPGGGGEHGGYFVHVDGVGNNGVEEFFFASEVVVDECRVHAGGGSYFADAYSVVGGGGEEFPRRSDDSGPGLVAFACFRHTPSITWWFAASSMRMRTRPQ